MCAHMHAQTMHMIIHTYVCAYLCMIKLERLAAITHTQPGWTRLRGAKHRRDRDKDIPPVYLIEEIQNLTVKGLAHCCIHSEYQSKFQST